MQFSDASIFNLEHDYAYNIVIRRGISLQGRSFSDNFIEYKSSCGFRKF